MDHDEAYLNWQIQQDANRAYDQVQADNRERDQLFARIAELELENAQLRAVADAVAVRANQFIKAIKEGNNKRAHTEMILLEIELENYERDCKEATK